MFSNRLSEIVYSAGSLGQSSTTEHAFSSCTGR